MKTVSELSKEVGKGLMDLHKESGLHAMCEEITNRIKGKRDEILVAWFAENGFRPGAAMLVEETTDSGIKVYVREKTLDEAKSSESTMFSDSKLSFGDAFHRIRYYKKGMRLPHWKEDVVIRVQHPDENSKMTTPYLYVESRYGRTPWKETMIELFSNDWCIVD